MQAGRNAGRQTDVQKDKCTNIHTCTIVHTYRNKDVQTYTDEQTDRQCRSAGRQAGRQTDRQTDRVNALSK